MGGRCDSDEGVDLHLGDPALHLHGRQRAQEDSWDKRPTDVKPQYPTLPKHETPRFYGAHKVKTPRQPQETAPEWRIS